MVTWALSACLRRDGGCDILRRLCRCSAAFAQSWRCCRPCSSSPSARAVTVPDLYETAQPVDGSRDAAFVEALKTVLVRVSGQRDAALRVGEISDPRKYVQRFGFTADNVLEVGFDSASVDQLLSKAGLPIWGRERPATVVMFGVEEAGGAWRWLAADTPAREREAIEQGRARSADCR